MIFFFGDNFFLKSINNYIYSSDILYCSLQMMGVVPPDHLISSCIIKLHFIQVVFYYPKLPETDLSLSLNAIKNIHSQLKQPVTPTDLCIIQAKTYMYKD